MISGCWETFKSENLKRTWVHLVCFGKTPLRPQQNKDHLSINIIIYWLYVDMFSSCHIHVHIACHLLCNGFMLRLKVCFYLIQLHLTWQLFLLAVSSVKLLFWGHHLVWGKLVFIVGWSYYWVKIKKKSMKRDFKKVVLIVEWSYFRGGFKAGVYSNCRCWLFKYEIWLVYAYWMFISTPINDIADFLVKPTLLMFV